MDAQIFFHTLRRLSDPSVWKLSSTASCHYGTHNATASNAGIACTLVNDLGDTNRVATCNVVNDHRDLSSVATCNVVNYLRDTSSVATCNVVNYFRDTSSVATSSVVKDPRDLSNMAIYHVKVQGTLTCPPTLPHPTPTPTHTNMAIYPVRSTRNVNTPPHPTPTPRQRAILKKEAKRTYGFPAVGTNMDVLCFGIGHVHHDEQGCLSMFPGNCQ